MKGIILVRHGETAWNVQKRFRGRADVALSRRGCEQAARVGEVLARRNIEAVYSSPLSRATRTAQAIGDACPHIKIEMDDRLVDIDYGGWTGKSHDQVSTEFHELYELWQQEPHKMKPPGGESLQEVKARMVHCVKDVATDHEGGVAIVSHRVSIKMLILGLLGLGAEAFWRLRVDTCSITTFEVNGQGYVLASLNETCHLGELKDKSGIDF